MSQGIVQTPASQAAANSFDALSPFSSKALFWRAGYVAPSTFLEHIPFMFWTVETARPGMVVSLGVADAVPYFAACQAIEKLNVEAICFAVETENHSDLDTIKLYNENNFPDFSEIITTDQTDLAQSLHMTEIDFFIVNKPLTQALADHINHLWLPLLSDQALILFTQGGDAALLQKYTDDLALDGGVFVASPVHGVHLVLRGRQHSDRLLRLAQLQPGKPGYLNVKNVFSRVGQWHSMFLQNRQGADVLAQAQTQRDAALKDLAENEHHLLDVKTRLAQVTNELAATTQQLATQRARISVSEAATMDGAQHGETHAHEERAQPSQEQTRLLEAEQAKNKELLARIARLEENSRTEIDTLEQQRDATHTQLSQQLQKTAQQRDTLQAAVDANAASAEQRYKELATLTQILEEREQQLQQQTSELSQTRHLLEQSKQTLAKVTSELSQTQHLLEQSKQALAKVTSELQQTKTKLGREKLHNQTLLQLAAAKYETSAALSASRVSKTHRAARSELDKQITQIRESELFDETWYRTTYPDIAASPLSPLEHFVQMGAYEGRNPGPGFDSMQYHMADPKIAASKMPALLHYLRHGKTEGRTVFSVKT